MQSGMSGEPLQDRYVVVGEVPEHLSLVSAPLQ